MKKNLLILSAFVALSVFAFGQSQRFVVFEEFTNASCAPCAAQNPAFHAMMVANTTKCTYVTYHWNFPGPNDPMYLANPTDVQARIGYYGFNFVPSCVMDGTTIPTCSAYYAGAPGCVTQTLINNRYAVPSPFELYVNQQLSPGNDSIYITVLGKATGSSTGSLVVHNVVIEKHIHYNSPPGSNGEKDFYNVMKKMLGGPSGTALPTSFEPGDYFVYRFGWKLANVISISELSAVSFIQNSQTKNVLQAANTSATPITGVYQNDLTLLNPGNLLTSYCEPSIEPTFELQNNGSLPLTSAEIKYRVNNEPEQTYTWNGNLDFLQKSTLSLPATAFTVQPSNVLKIYGVKTNGGDDEYKKNDTVTYNFPAAKVTPTQLKLYIKTDNNPQEITWDIKDLQGNIMQSGGPYANANYGYSTTINLPAFNCYEFTIHDAGGNGITVPGYFSLYYTAGTNVVVLTGTNFGTSAVCQFSTFSGVGVDEEAGAELFSVYPNPVSGKATVSLTNTASEQVSIQVYDILGKLLINRPNLEYSAGKHEIEVDCRKLIPGIYTFKVTAGGNVYSKKVSVK